MGMGGGEGRKRNTASHFPCDAVLRSPMFRFGGTKRPCDGISAFPIARRAKIRKAFRYSFRIAVTAHGRHAFCEKANHRGIIYNRHASGFIIRPLFAAGLFLIRALP